MNRFDLGGLALAAASCAALIMWSPQGVPALPVDRTPPGAAWDGYEGMTVLLGTGCGPDKETRLAFEEDEMGGYCDAIESYWVEGQPR